MKKIGLILVLIILVSLQFFLPRYTARQLEESLQEEVDDYQSLQVELNTWPAVELFLNRADQVEIKGDNIVVDRLKLATLRAEFRDLKLAERAGDWEVVRAENRSLYLLLREKDLNDYLKTKDELDIFKRVKLDLTPTQVILKGVISFFDAEVTLQLTGDFSVVEGEKIIFRSDKLAVENFLVSTSSIKQLKDKLQFELDLAELELPLDVRKVNLESDKLEILGPNSENN